MKSILIDNTEITVSRLSFGTASLHHLFSIRQRQALLGAACDAGITHFDTSPYYGYGLAEHDLGKFLSGQRQKFTVTTKVGLYAPGRAARGGLDTRVKKALGKIHKPYSKPMVDWSIRRSRKSLEESLGRLKCDFVDFLFLHEPELGITKADEFLRWMEEEKARGTIRYWGLAGEKWRLEPWMNASHPICAVLQTTDNTIDQTANFIIDKGRQLQFTYGYLSSLINEGDQISANGVLTKALKRNDTGSVLISTRQIGRIKTIGKIVI